MGYIESLMANNEAIVYRTRKHWVAPLFATAAGTALTIGGIVALGWTLFVDDGWQQNLLMWGGLIALLVGIVLVARSLIIWWSTDYLVTNQKVMKVSGILRKTAGGAGLEKINDVTMEQGILGRMLDFGTLVVLTAADESNLNYTVMRKPAEFRRAMLDAKQLFEQADARYIADAMRGRMPPGLNEADPGVTQETLVVPTPEPPDAPSQTPSPTPASTSSGTVAPADVPAMIERLAALRDQGVLSEAEFEAKKAELLGRL